MEVDDRAFNLKNITRAMLYETDFGNTSESKIIDKKNFKSTTRHAFEVAMLMSLQNPEITNASELKASIINIMLHEPVTEVFYSADDFARSSNNKTGIRDTKEYQDLEKGIPLEFPLVITYEGITKQKHLDKVINKLFNKKSVQKLITKTLSHRKEILSN